MNIVVLSALNRPAPIYITDRLRSAFSDLRTIQIVWKSKKRSTGKRLNDISPARVLHHFNYRFQSRRGKRLGGQIREHLFGDGAEPTIPVDVRMISSALGTEEGIDTIRALEPDILVLCVAPIIPPEVFSIARLATVNIHFGIAPEYRGEHTLFWPLYYRDYDHIGITLHHVNKGIDAGNVLARGYPSLAGDDTEATIWAKCSRLAADLATDFLRTAGNGHIEGLKQTAKGRLFLRKYRKTPHDLRYQTRRAVLRERLPELPQRIEKYF